MTSQTTGAIALRPTGNAHSSYYFYHLNTECILNRSRWTKLPMPTDVIERVIEPMNPILITREQKRAALQFLMFLKKKRCGQIKVVVVLMTESKGYTQQKRKPVRR